MIRSIQASSERFLANLARIQARSQKAERQITSGLRVSQPSDAPDQIGSILQLRADIQRNEQIRTDLTRVVSEVNTAEKSLQTAVTLVERAVVLASKGAGTLETAATRATLATEVRGLHEHMVGLSRTQVEGRFIFSGDQDQQPAYSLNLTNPNGVQRLITAAATRQIQDSTAVTFPVTRRAQDIFDHRNPDDSLATDNVFAALNGLRIALEANDQPGIDASLATLRQAGQYLNSQLSFYGATQSRIDQAVDRLEKITNQFKEELSAREDADIVAASLDMNQAETHLNAAMSARARLPRTSLFDYLG